MSKIILWIIAGVVVVGGGYVVVTKMEKNEPEKVNNEVAEKPTGKKIPFSELIKQNGSYECTVNQYVGNIETKGKTYMDGGMLRGEFSTEARGMDIDSTFIIRDGYSYMWTSTLPNTGFKVKVVENVEGGDASASGKYGFNAEQIGDYDCKVWTPDNSKFTLPTGVNFVTYGN